MQDNRYYTGKSIHEIQLWKCMNTLLLIHHIFGGGSSWWPADHILSAFHVRPNTLVYHEHKLYLNLLLVHFFTRATWLVKDTHWMHLDVYSTLPCIMDPSRKIRFLCPPPQRGQRSGSATNLQPWSWSWLCVLLRDRTWLKWLKDCNPVINRPPHLSI